MESSSGVIVGREKKHCLMASSKTDERFVLRSISDWLSLMGLRSCKRRLQPRVLNDRLSSSIKVNVGGMRGGKCFSKYSRSLD